MEFYYLKLIKKNNMNSELEGNLAILQKYWPSSKGIGGSERATERFSSAIAEERKMAVCVYTCGDYARGHFPSIGTEFPQIKTVKTGLKLLTYPSMPAIAEAIVRNTEQVSILQIGWGFEHYPNDMSKLLQLRLPTVLRICETGHLEQLFQEVPQDKRPEYRQILLKGIDRVVAISRPLAEEALAFGFSSEQVKIVYSSVPTEIFRPLETNKSFLRRKLGLPENSFIFLYAGRLVEEKGVDLLLEAWKVLSQGLTDGENYPYLVLIGSLSNEGKTALILKETLRQHSTVIYKGVIPEQNDVALYYQISDLLVYPSFHREGLALSVVEAMSSGLPVLTTNWAATETGMRDLVIPGKTGFVFEGKNPLSLARQLNLLFSQSDTLSGFGLNARNHVLSLGVDDKIAAKNYLNVYREIIGSKKGNVAIIDNHAN